MNLNLRQLSSRLSTRGWITVGAAVIIGLVFIVVVMSLASKPSYTTILTGQSPAQAEKITTALASGGVQYQLDNDGTAIAVESSDAGQARDLLGNQGLLAGAGSSSFEQLLGNQSLGESNFQQQESSTSALQQELEQTIEGMNGINSAQVQLAIPDESDDLFNGVNQQPSASILLNTDGNISSTVPKAIAEDVANAVSGLSTSHVTITDQSGDLLWPSTGSTSSALTAKQTAEQAYDSQIAEEADAYLESTVGVGKAVVSVNADLNTNQQTVQSVTYGSKKVPLTSATSKEDLNGNPNAANAAGNTATNLAAYASTTTTGNTKYTDDTNTVSNGVDKTISNATITPGAVNRQTISVLVNSSVPATEDAAIESAVEGTVGYKAGRDTITLGTVSFAKVKPVAATTKSVTSDLKYVLIGLGSLLFVLFLIRALRRRESDDFAGRPTWLRELEYPRSLSELEGQTHMVDLDAPAVVARLRPPVNVARQQVEDLVDRDPERVAAQIRQWMTED